MEWKKPQIVSYSEEDLMKELQVKANSGSDQDHDPDRGNGNHYGWDHHH